MRFLIIVLLFPLDCLAQNSLVTSGEGIPVKEGLVTTKSSSSKSDTFEFAQGIHPFLDSQLQFAGLGYGGGFVDGVGFDLEKRRFRVQAEAEYGFVRKTNDADQVPNEHGHTRHLQDEVFYRLHRNFFGAGVGWGETAVTPYRKYAWTVRTGWGHDFGDRDFNLRLQAAYLHELGERVVYPELVQFTPGPGQSALSYSCSCTSGVSGVDVNAWMPSPAFRGHFFLHYELLTIRFHETVTDPYNTALTASQSAQHSIAGQMTLSFVVRY